MVGNARGSCTVRSFWSRVAPDISAASTISGGTPLNPSIVYLVSGTAAKISIENTTATSLTPKSIIAGIKYIKLGKVCAVSQASSILEDHLADLAASIPSGIPMNVAKTTAEITVYRVITERSHHPVTATIVKKKPAISASFLPARYQARPIIISINAGVGIQSKELRNGIKTLTFRNQRNHSVVFFIASIAKKPFIILSISLPWEKLCLRVTSDKIGISCDSSKKNTKANSESRKYLCFSHHLVLRSKCTGCFKTHALDIRSSMIANKTIVIPISKLRPILNDPIIAKSFAPKPGIPMNAVRTTIARHNMITWLTPTSISVLAAGM